MRSPPIDLTYGVGDLVGGMLKGLVMGWMVALIACYHGFCLRKSAGAEGVGQATNLAIVHGAVFCIVANLFLSWMIYG